jgi:hypothetical protein
MKTADTHKPLFHVLMIILFSILACINTYDVPFQFNDKQAIVENPIIKDIRLFTEPSKAEVFRGLFEYPAFKVRYNGYLTYAFEECSDRLNPS